ncbi:MAG: PQQ-binding-like beta-propeller repeat protein [Myxococcota bacterium]
MRRSAALALALALAAMLGPRAEARPVRVGRFARIPYGVSVAHPWRTGQGDPARRARSAFEAPAEPPRRRWRERVGGGRVFTPSIAEDGTIFVASQAGLAAVTPAGELSWAIELGLVAHTPSITPDGSIVAGANQTDLVFVRAGRVVLRTRVGGVVRGSPLVLADGSVVVSAWDQAVHRFDAEGRRLFRRPLRASVRGAPALGPAGRVWVPSGSELLQLDAEGGRRESVGLGAEIVNGPAIGEDGRAWVVLEDGTLHAVSRDGQPILRTPLDIQPSPGSNLAIARDGSLRVASASGALVAIAPGGSVRWRYEEGRIVGGVTVDAAGVALTRDQSGAVVAVDAQGSLRWRLAIEGHGSAAPVLGADGTLYVPEASGALSAWR